METVLVIFLITVYCIMSYGFMFSLFVRLIDSKVYRDSVKRYGEMPLMYWVLFLYIFSPISAIYFYGMKLENS